MDRTEETITRVEPKLRYADPPLGEDLNPKLNYLVISRRVVNPS